MTKDNQKGKSENNIEVTINEGFYFDRSLELPTVIKEYKRVEKILWELQYMACITVQIEELSRIEYLYGSNTYNYLLTRITEKLKTIKNREFRGQDIFVVDLYDADTFVIFLSPPREDKTRLVYHLEDIAERIRIALEKEVFDLLHPFLQKWHRP